MPKLVALLLVAATACGTATADVAPSTTTPYSCAGIVVGDQQPSADPAVLAPWYALLRAPQRDQAWADRARALALRWRSPALGTETKVRLQHALVNIARDLDHLRRFARASAIHDDSAARVMALARQIAPSAAELELLGEGNSPAVHAVLGPALGVVERATRSCGRGNSIHVALASGLLAFRPLRADRTRALVSQLVAFDTEGAPHVTPIVEGMELRQGDEVDAPACVVEARLDGTLAAMRHAELHEHGPFVQRRGDGLGCRGCHSTADAVGARDLPANELDEVDAARTRQVERLASGVWNSLAGAPARLPR